MSKASEWATRAGEFAKDGPPDFTYANAFAAGVLVLLDGTYRMRIESQTRDTEWEPETALAFARWILDTFGEADA